MLFRSGTAAISLFAFNSEPETIFVTDFGPDDNPFAPTAQAGAALYQAWLNVLPVRETSPTPRFNYDVVGPVCESGDFLARNRDLAIERGDLLAIAGAGAYGFVMSSNYNTRGRAAEIIVDGDQAHLVRPRESISELFATETVLEGSG